MDPGGNSYEHVLAGTCWYRYYTYMQGKVPCAEPLAQRALHKNQLFCGAFTSTSVISERQVLAL